MKCQICDQEDAKFAWTDTHGVAQCINCGAPYKLLHYEAGKQVIRPELVVISIESFRDCFKETKAKFSAVGMKLSFPGGQDIATRDDIDKVTAWKKAQEESEQ